METKISVILHDELPAGTLCLSTEKWVLARFRASMESASKLGG